MKARIGVDAGSGMVHPGETAAANGADIEIARKLIREDDEMVNAEAGAVYRGLAKNTARLYTLFARANLMKGGWPPMPYERRAST
jgi:IS5 family transposase